MFASALRRSFATLRAAALHRAPSSLLAVGVASAAAAMSVGSTTYDCALFSKPKAPASSIPEEPTHFTAPGVSLDPKTEENMAAIRKLPVEAALLTAAPAVPPPIKRNYPVRMVVDLTSRDVLLPVSETQKYPMWTFNDTVPGPFIRAREGDIVEIHHLNKDSAGVAHNIDFHAVTGPGGGAACTLSEQDQTTVGIFQMLKPGLYIYHCAAGPVPQHVQNGMYGLILVEPKEGLPPVDKEFYVVQSEFYGSTDSDDPKLVEPSYADGLIEHPMYVVFNGKRGSLTEKPLSCNQGERVRIFFGNAGPNLISSFHTIGIIFDQVYREGDLMSAPARNLQTTLVPAGGSVMVEFDAVVPGNYTLVDHSIFRTEKGAIGFLKVNGKPRPDIYDAVQLPTPCPGCKMHN